MKVTNPSLVTFVLGAWLLPQCVVQAATKADYYRLHNFLFVDYEYKKELRPVDDDSEAVFVYMEFSLLSLVDVDEKDQKLVTSARLQLTWIDDFLAWNVSAYEGIRSLMVPQESVWLPDLVLSNGVTAQTQFGYKKLPVRLDDDGWISWQPTVLLSTSCDIGITYFPFDTQKCDIEFETSISNAAEVDINIDKEEPITLEDYNQDGQWDLRGTKAVNLANEKGKSKIKYTIILHRRRTFYLIYIILPIFFLSLTASLVFALPPDEGEKTGTGITVVLAFAVYLTIVADLVPNTSLQVSILGVYLILLLGMSSISLIVCVFILDIYFRDNSTPVGNKTRQTVVVLRNITFMKPLGAARNAVSPTQSLEMQNVDNPKKGGNPPQPENQNSFFQEDRMTWQVVAKTLDWFCFIVFSSLTIIVTMTCFIALEVGS